MSWRIAKGRAAGKHVKKIEWTETPIARAPSMALMARNSRTGGLRLAKGEFKSLDSYTVTALDTTGSLVLLNGCARGSDINQRVGREILMKSIQLNFQSAVTSGTGVDQTHRWMLVYDKQANAAALTAAQVLDLTAATATMAMRNLENRKRFVILMDKVFRLSATGESDSGRTFRFYKRVNLPVTFNTGTAGAIADIVTGSLYVLTMGNVAAGSTAGTGALQARVRFVDK